MGLRFSRQQDGSCDSGKYFYRCAKGPYSGCCSSNPCDTGVCGDDSDSSPTTAKASNNLSTTISASLSTNTPSRSSAATSSTSAITSAGSIKSISTSTSRSSTTSTLSATSTSATTPSSTTPSSSTLQPGNATRRPVGAIVGGVLGGLAFLALLAALLRYCLQRKSKLRIRIGRAKKGADKKREKELLEAETAILEREKFLDAVKQKAEPQIRNGDPFAEFGGYHRDNVAGRPGHRYYHQNNQPTSSISTPPQAKKSLPVITTTPAPAATPSIAQQSNMPLSSISEKENIDSVPILDGNELTLSEMSVDTNQASLNQQAADQNGTASSPTVLHIDPLAPPTGRRVTISARTSRAQSTDLSSVSSNTNSYANTGSPISPAQPKDFVAQDGVVMRSNLNGSWNRRPRPGSVRKHVMSFMEYDTENDSLCSSSRRSSLRVPGKAFLPADQGRGSDHQDSSLRR